MDLDRAMRVAVRAAYQAADVLRTGMETEFQIRKKGPRDLVTDLDLASEKIIVDTLRGEFPDHAIVAEESGTSLGEADDLWLVDPLDGTVNFAHRLPFYAVSIALLHRGSPCIGVVLNPLSGELFSAMAGNGACLNGRPIRVSGESRVAESLLATGFPYDFGSGFEGLVNRLKRCLKAAGGIRRLGSAALDLCFVACGRFEGYWEQTLQPWDMAAGLLIVKEAGGRVSDLSGGPQAIEKREILATNGRIHAQLLALMEEGSL